MDPHFIPEATERSETDPADEDNDLDAVTVGAKQHGRCKCSQLVIIIVSSLVAHVNLANFYI